jgi:hypothetical protein
VREKVKPAEILCRLNAHYGEMTLSHASVCGWYRKFSEAIMKFKTQLLAGKIITSVFLTDKWFTLVFPLMV